VYIGFSSACAQERGHFLWAVPILGKSANFVRFSSNLQDTPDGNMTGILQAAQ
jgi:hypothetical protein